MKKLLSGFAAIAIAIASFAMVQAKYGNAAVDCSSIGGSGAVWYFYNGPIPASASDIVNPANFTPATALQISQVCTNTVKPCAVCAIPQEENADQPELSEDLAPDTRAGLLDYVATEQSQTTQPSSYLFIREKL